MQYFGFMLLKRSVCFFSAGTRSTTKKIQDGVFSTVAFPIGIFVTVIFWGIWMIDRNFVFPAVLDQYYPSYINHFMHTSSLPLQILEQILKNHTYPSKKIGALSTLGFSSIYILWISFIAYYGGFWVYPLFGILARTPRIIFMIFCALLTTVFYFVGYLMNLCIWNSNQDKSKEMKQT